MTKLKPRFGGAFFALREAHPLASPGAAAGACHGGREEETRPIPGFPALVFIEAVESCRLASGERENFC